MNLLNMLASCTNKCFHNLKFANEITYKRRYMAKRHYTDGHMHLGEIYSLYVCLLCVEEGSRASYIVKIQHFCKLVDFRRVSPNICIYHINISNETAVISVSKASECCKWQRIRICYIYGFVSDSQM